MKVGGCPFLKADQAMIVDTDPDPVPEFDMIGIFEEVDPLHLLAVEKDRQRIIPSRLFDGRRNIVVAPFGKDDGHASVSVRPFVPNHGLFSAEGVRGGFDRP